MLKVVVLSILGYGLFNFVGIFIFAILDIDDEDTLIIFLSGPVCWYFTILCLLFKRTVIPRKINDGIETLQQIIKNIPYSDRQIKRIVKKVCKISNKKSIFIYLDSWSDKYFSSIDDRFPGVNELVYWRASCRLKKSFEKAYYQKKELVIEELKKYMTRATLEDIYPSKYRPVVDFTKDNNIYYFQSK